MKILQRPLVMGGLAIAFVVGMATAAGAVPISLNAVVGPLPVPSGPVTVCVSPGPGCVTTPSATSVTLSTSVTVDGGLGLPMITAGLCPAGELGSAFNIASGATKATIGGTAAFTVTSLPSPLVIPIGPVTIGPGANGTVSACFKVGF